MIKGERYGKINTKPLTLIAWLGIGKIQKRQWEEEKA